MTRVFVFWFPFLFVHICALLKNGLKSELTYYYEIATDYCNIIIIICAFAPLSVYRGLLLFSYLEKKEEAEIAKFWKQPKLKCFNNFRASRIVFSFLLLFCLSKRWFEFNMRDRFFSLSWPCIVGSQMTHKNRKT